MDLLFITQYTCFIFMVINAMILGISSIHVRWKNKGQWKFSGDKHKSLQVDTERTFHQRYPLVML